VPVPGDEQRFLPARDSGPNGAFWARGAQRRIGGGGDEILAARLGHACVQDRRIAEFFAGERPERLLGEETPLVAEWNERQHGNAQALLSPNFEGAHQHAEMLRLDDFHVRTGSVNP
jgi:hypothetical protein